MTPQKVHPAKACEFCTKPLVIRVTRDETRKRFCSHSCRQKALLRDRPRLMHSIKAAQKRAATRHSHPHKVARSLRQCTQCHQPFMGTYQQLYCPVCAPSKVWVRRIQRYGLSKPAWDARLAQQNGKCWLCDQPPQVVDHDHTTGLVRGLLCHGCNTALNRVERLGWVEAAKAYLERCHEPLS